MKKCFLICSVLIASLFLFSCANSVAEYGTITLRLPGSNNRAAVTVSELSFNVEVTNQDTSEVTTQSAGAGENCSIDLPKGMYTVKVEAYKAAKKDQILFTGSKTDVEIIPGKETPVSLKLKSVYEDVDLNATIKIETVTKGDLVMEVEELGSQKINFTIKSLSGRPIKSCSWVINGVPAENGKDSNETEVITINNNVAYFNFNLIYNFTDKYHLQQFSNPLTCVVEFQDGNIEDISYLFDNNI